MERTNETAPRTTAKERETLDRLIRDREKVLKTMAKQRTAQLMADVEEQMATIFKPDDERWAEVVKESREIVGAANEHILKMCEASGIPADFAPELALGFLGRRESADRERRAEFRKVAQTRLAAVEQQAFVFIEQQCLEARTVVLSDGITSDAGRQMLNNLPKVEDLMPALDVATLQDQIPALPDLAKKYANQPDYSFRRLLGSGE